MKLLVFSNNPLVYSNSNGRTLLNMLIKFRHKDILNIYVNGGGEFQKEINYIKINEGALLRNKRPFCNVVEGLKKESDSVVYYGKKKTVFKCLIRSLIWKKSRLFLELKDFVSSFKPNAILLQCGDADFLINIAIKISKAFNLPLISFNSEDYIFKNWNYLEKKRSSSLLYEIFARNLRKAYENLYKQNGEFIYLTQLLESEYVKKYPNHKHHVIYNSTSLSRSKTYNPDGIILYSGNLGVGRVDTLITLSEMIYKTFNKKVTVCSLTEDRSIIEKIKKSQFMNFLGKVDYDENVKLLKSSSLVLHVESLNKFYIKDTKNAFSTKIADCLSSGVPFFVIAPQETAIYQYLSFFDCAFVYHDFNAAFEALQNIKKTYEARLNKVEKALMVAALNHNAAKNSEIFYNIVREALL